MTEPDTTYTDDEIAAALMADMPEPDPAFEAELRTLVRDAFPRRRRLPAFKLSKPLIAVGASAVLAVGVAVPLLSGGDDEQLVPAMDGGGEAARDMAAPEATSIPAPVPPTEDFIAKSRERRIERSASLTPVSYTHLTLPTTPYV